MRALALGVRAGAIAGIVSGIPSTLWSTAASGDPLQATKAAGSILLPDESRTMPLVLAAIPVHAFLSTLWATVLTATVPRRRPRLWGAMAGLLIAALDLGLIGRRFPRVRALPTVPQLADHLLFGWTVGAVLRHHSARDSAVSG